MHYDGGSKENLVGDPLSWPGVSSDRALAFGEPLKGKWYDRSKYYEAKRKRKPCNLEDFATTYTVSLATLPDFEGIPKAEVQKYYQELLEDIKKETWQRHMDQGTRPLGKQAVLKQNPLATPRKTKRSPAPICHASDYKKRYSFKRAYRRFAVLYRKASYLFRNGATDVVFPKGSFPPPPAFCYLTTVASPP